MRKLIVKLRNERKSFRKIEKIVNHYYRINKWNKKNHGQV